jgi:hypothetical protein
METETKRGPGRPRKTPEEPMEIEVKAAAAEPKPEAAPSVKLYTFKMLKGTNFIDPIKIIDVDEEGNWLEPRDSEKGREHGAQSKVWPGTIVQVNGKLAAHFDKHSIAKRIDQYE